MPMGDCCSVQKKTWCGVLGLSSVATTRPITSDTGSFQELFHRVHSIEQPVPAGVGADGCALRHHPARKLIRQRERLGSRRSLEANQTIKEGFAGPAPKPERPGGDPGALSRARL